MRQKLKILSSLKVKFGIITFFTYMILVTVILLACYNHFFHNMKSTYEGIGMEILNNASDDIIIDHIPQYLSGDYDRDEYSATQAKLDKYVEYYKEIYYLYVYKINEGSDIATVLFDAKTDHDDVEHLGDDYELEPGLADNLDKMVKGEPLDTLVDNTQWGYLMTCSKPLIGSDGECKGYIFVDFNLTLTKKDDILFIQRLFVVVFLITLIVLYLGMRAVSKRITGPIERMYRCLKGFRYDTNEDREENFERLKELDINTNPEIQSLYNALVQTTLESYTYQQEYQVAAERLGLASEMAYKDALTGVNNKNSYDNELKDIQKQIDNGEKLDISVLMIDINNLKNVNDTYGHSNGDLYIIGCCDIIRKRCRNSHIYRIGGDEFTVLLKGKDYDDRQNIYSDIVSGFESAFTDRARQLWERYSASVGMADYGLGDASFSDAVKRADSAMYKAKSEFKEKYGSYR